MSSPKRNLIQPGSQLVIQAEAGAFTKHGFWTGGEDLVLRDEQASMTREISLVFTESLTILDQQLSLQPGMDFSEHLTLRELTLGYLNAALVSGPEKPLQTPASTLTAGFGQGGFGQLGFGGTISVTG